METKPKFDTEKTIFRIIVIILLLVQVGLSTANFIGQRTQFARNETYKTEVDALLLQYGQDSVKMMTDYQTAVYDNPKTDTIMKQQMIALETILTANIRMGSMFRDYLDLTAQYK